MGGYVKEEGRARPKTKEVGEVSVSKRVGERGGVPLPAHAVRMSEAAFTDAVIQYAQLRGWLVAHFRPCRTEKGWRTAVQGDVGFPDLVLGRDGYLIVAELKSETGGLSIGQVRWFKQLTGLSAKEIREGPWPVSSPGLDVYVWKPSDWPAIEERLR